MVGDEGRMRLCGKGTYDAGQGLKQVRNREHGQRKKLDSHAEEQRAMWQRVSVG